MHLSFDVYLTVLHSGLPLEVWTHIAQGHLLELCSECGSEWKAAGRDASELAPELAPFPIAPRPSLPPAPLPADDDEIGLAGLDDRRDHYSTVLLNRRRAQEDLDRLLALPAAERLPCIENAQSRYRSRALADQLIEASRARARTDPAEAASLAALVPAVLRWMPEPGPGPWVRILLARAQAHRADALRRSGDLDRAEELFDELRRELDARPLADPAAGEEIAALEAAARN